MTYFQFHLLFLLPPIALLLLAAWRAGPPLAGRLEADASRAWRALALIIALALCYTTPWDNYLVARGVWGYSPGRVLFTVGYVPIEEYVFFMLQPILSGLLLFSLARRAAPPAAVPLKVQRLGPWLGAGLFLLLALLGLVLLREPQGLYLGLILVWAMPVAALQWGVGGRELLAWWRLVVPAVALPTLYLWLADRVALELGIWWISSRYTTGGQLLGLPLEEMLFFFMTNVIVVQGLVLFLVMGRRLSGRWAAQGSRS